MTKLDILRNVNGYEIDVLANRVLEGFLTYDELCIAGLNHAKRNPLKEKLEIDAWQKCEQENSEEAYKLFAMHYPQSKHATEAENRYKQMLKDASMEEEFWKNAQTDNTIKAYRLYVSKYPSGKYVSSAQFKMEMIEQEENERKEIILNDMLYAPHKYTEYQLKEIISKSESGITANDLIERDIITEDALNSILEERILQIHMPQHHDWEDLPPLPQNNTDVYFFGVPISGKSCVLTGLLSSASKQGHIEYKPHYTNEKVDPFQDYYYGIMECLDNSLPPKPTAKETCNFMSITLRNDDNSNSKNDLTFIEIGGEYFIDTTRILTDLSVREGWKGMGATEYLKSNNRKMIFFVIDYSIESGARKDFYTPVKQAQALDRAITVFSNDGEKHGTNDCTFSRTDTIIVIVTKSDLMPTNNKDERNIIARDYLNEKHKNFMENLRELCKSFNINKAAGHRPIITTFSLGRFMIGNTVDFIEDDSKDLVEIIRNYSRSQKNGGFLDVVSKLFSLG